MKTTPEKALMKRLPLDASDAARLVLECVEELGEPLRSRQEMLRRLRQVMREGIAALKCAEQTECFEKVAWASVEQRAHRRPATRRDLRNFVRRMLRVEEVGVMPLRRMTPAICRSLLEKAFGASMHSFKKGRAILHSIFAYGVRHELCDSNPVDRIESPAVLERTIHPLSLEEVERLESAARLPEHRGMRFSLQLMLYCGLRPNEVRRLQPEDIRAEEGVVVIRPAVSKTGGGRVVPLRCRVPRGEQLIPRNWEVRWRRLRRAAGFSCWQADVCRHSFASYHVAFYRNLAVLQCEMGHGSLQLLRSRYISPVSLRDASRFWRCCPSALRLT